MNQSVVTNLQESEIWYACIHRQNAKGNMIKISLLFMPPNTCTFSIQILHMNFHFKTPDGIFQDITNKCSDDFFCTCIMLNVFLFVFVKSVKAGRNFPSFRCLTPLLVPLMAPPPQHVYTCCFYCPYTSIIVYFIALYSVLSVYIYSVFYCIVIQLLHAQHHYVHNSAYKPPIVLDFTHSSKV